MTMKRTCAESREVASADCGGIQHNKIDPITVDCLRGHRGSSDNMNLEEAGRKN